MMYRYVRVVRSIIILCASLLGIYCIPRVFRNDLAATGFAVRRAEIRARAIIMIIIR